MPGLAPQHLQIDVHVVRKSSSIFCEQRALDDDAQSDRTLDDVDCHFGAPLERFDTSFQEDGDNGSYALDDEDLYALRIAQDEEWLAYESDAGPSSVGSGTPSECDDLPATPETRRHVPATTVTVKEVDIDSAELELLEYLNTDEHRDDPWNHSIPVLDTVVDHECDISSSSSPSSSKRVKVVMQRLQPFDSPPFQNVAECLDLARQLLEGTAFFHEHRITRLDFSRKNIGMDTGLLPVTAPNWDRSEHHVQYHLIDMSAAARYPGVLAPEQEAVWDDSEREDVRQLGTSLQSIFSKMPGMSFLSPFLESMTAPIPAARTAADALADLDAISAELPPEKIFERFTT